MISTTEPSYRIYKQARSYWVWLVDPTDGRDVRAVAVKWTLSGARRAARSHHRWTIRDSAKRKRPAVLVDEVTSNGRSRP